MIDRQILSVQTQRFIGDEGKFYPREMFKKLACRNKKSMLARITLMFKNEIQIQMVTF